VKKRVWSKFEPGTTAVVVGEPDVRGFSPAYIASHAYEEEFQGQIAASIKLEEWSDTELAPLPESVPQTCWVVLHGTDPDDPQCIVAFSEKDAAVLAAKTPNAWGYVTAALTAAMTVV
jgi:hypothetical protein